MRARAILLELPFKHDMILPFYPYIQLPFKSDIGVSHVTVGGGYRQMSNLSTTHVHFVGDSA